MFYKENGMTPVNLEKEQIWISPKLPQDADTGKKWNKASYLCVWQLAVLTHLQLSYLYVLCKQFQNSAVSFKCCHWPRNKKLQKEMQTSGLRLRPHRRKIKLAGISQHTWDTQFPNDLCLYFERYVRSHLLLAVINNWTNTIAGISRWQYCLDSFSDTVE